MIRVREAREEDVSEIREIFLAVYGADYPHHEVYDELWLKRSVFTDDALILVAEDPEVGRVIGTASVLFDFGAHSDLVGEFGRLAVHPDYRGRQVGKLLMEKRLEAIRNRLHMGLVVARTVHPYAQRISLAEGFIPAGFLPLKHFFRHRESFALLARYFGDALALRRNHPRIIPEAYPLANLVMRHSPLAPDFIVDEDAAPYPAGGTYTIEQLQAEGYPALLRIERGRVRNREIFGPMRLDYGFFKLQARQTSYFLARSEGHIVGAVGYTLDPVEHIVRVFELIALADDVVRFLLVEFERKCREEMGIQYIEIDVSAYAPRMQRTLLELNFLPVAYVPAMVFDQVERLDIVKMVRLDKLQDLGPLALVEPMQAVADVVMRGFAACVVAPRMAQAIKYIPLFAGMTGEQARRLAGACTVRAWRDGERLFAAHDPADRLYIVLEGRVVISGGTPGSTIGTVRTGEICGEVSLLSAKPHSATATAQGRVEAAELRQGDLAEVIRRRPDIGVIIYRNLAVGLGEKLLRTGGANRDRGAAESAMRASGRPTDRPSRTVIASVHRAQPRRNMTRHFDSRAPLGLLVLLAIVLVAPAGSPAAEVPKATPSGVACDGPFKRKSPTTKALRDAIEAHRSWLEDDDHRATRRANLCQADLRNRILSGATLERANLDGAILSQVDLTRANLILAGLARADLAGAVLEEANLSGADGRRARLVRAKANLAIGNEAAFFNAAMMGGQFREATFEGAHFEGADLRGSNWSESDLTETYFYGANLAGAVLAGAELMGADLRRTDLTKADLHHANLEGAVLDGARLRSARLVDANLEGAFLDGADLTEATLRDAVLRGTDLRYSKLDRADFQEADLEGANLERAGLAKTNLQSANLSMAVLYRATLAQTDFRAAQLSRAVLILARGAGADFSKADLTEIHAPNSVLTGAHFNETKLEAANFVSADLSGAELLQADLTGANLQDAKLRGARLSDADLSGARIDGADLHQADLRGAHLGSVIGLTQVQLDAACVDPKTELPGGLTRPPPCKKNTTKHRRP